MLSHYAQTPSNPLTSKFKLARITHLSTLPTGIIANDISNTFYIEKIDKIRDELDLSTQTPSYKKYDGPVFEIFTPVSQAYVLHVVMKCKKTFIDHDPLPAVWISLYPTSQIFSMNHWLMACFLLILKNHCLFHLSRKYCVEKL